MTAKKLICAIAAAAVLACQGAGLTVYAQTQALKPANKSYAWLEDVYIRESPDQYSLNELIPLADYPYSRTRDEFRQDVDTYLAANTIDQTTFDDKYYFILSQANSVMIALGASGSYAVQRQWLEQEAGIVFPDENTPYIELYTGVLYGAMRFKLFKALYGHDLVIPGGVTLERAIVLYLDSATDTKNLIPITGVDTVKAYGVASMRQTLIAYDGNAFGVDANTSEDDLFRYTSIMVIRKAGYTIDSDATETEINALYFITVLNRIYGIKISPAEMAVALALPKAEQNEAVQMLILKTMAEEKGQTLPNGVTLDYAFGKALDLGYFKLGNDFYSDIYKYRIELQYKRPAVWFSPLSFADQMPGGSPKNVLIKINGSPVKDRMPAKITLDTKKKQQTVTVAVAYQNGSVSQNRTYEFTFVQGKASPPGTTAAETTVPAYTTKPDYSTGPYVTSPEGTTYYIDGTLPDGSFYVTNADGTIIGVNDDYQTSSTGTGDAGTTAESGEDTGSGKSMLLEKWPVAAGALVLLLAAGGGAGYAILKKQGKFKEKKF